MLYIKECKAVCKSIVFWVFVLIMILFYSTQYSSELSYDLKLTKAPEGEHVYNAKPSALLPPDTKDEELGYKEAEIPEQIMPNVMAVLATEHSENEFIGYPFGFFKVTKLSKGELADIEQIMTDITGLNSEEILGKINDAKSKGKIEPLPNSGISQIGEDADYTDVIPIIVDFDTFKEKMKKVDKLIGGSSIYAAENFSLYSFEPITNEEVQESYDSFINEDKITNAYARLFCDYMGILISLLGIFVPVAFLLRDRRARVKELVYPRKISSLKLIGTRYLSMITMMFVPILLLSLEPLIRIAIFAAKQGFTIDYFAFAKYSFAWLLPSILVVVSMAFFFTILTDTPIAIIIQFAWSLITIFQTASDLGGLAGKSGFSFVIRFNLTGNYSAVQEQMTALIINRVSYSLFAILLLAFAIILFEQKRKGRLDVRSKLRKNTRISQDAV